jgi:hypothetical protein
MSSMLADRMKSRKTYSLPPRLTPPRETAGPVFFATHSVSDLKHWDAERLRHLGTLPFPMGHSRESDRYEIKLWGEVLAIVADAINRCKVVTLVGSSASASELSTLQTLFHHHTGKTVELMECSGECGPGHVWSSTAEGQMEPVTDVERVVIALGSVPSMLKLGGFCNCTTLFVHEVLTPGMFELAGPAFVVPLSRSGWKLSHIAFHRLLDIETELSSEQTYRGMFDDATSFARPLCFILAELFKMIRGKRAEQAVEAGRWENWAD